MRRLKTSETISNESLFSLPCMSFRITGEHTAQVRYSDLEIPVPCCSLQFLLCHPWPVDRQCACLNVGTKTSKKLHLSSPLSLMVFAFSDIGSVLCRCLSCALVLILPITSFLLERQHSQSPDSAVSHISLTPPHSFTRFQQRKDYDM